MLFCSFHIILVYNVKKMAGDFVFLFLSVLSVFGWQNPAEIISIFSFICIFPFDVGMWKEWSIIFHHLVDLCFDLLSAAEVCLNGRLYSQI